MHPISKEYTSFEKTRFQYIEAAPLAANPKNAPRPLVGARLRLCGATERVRNLDCAQTTLRATNSDAMLCLLGVVFAPKPCIHTYIHIYIYIYTLEL